VGNLYRQLPLFVNILLESNISQHNCSCFGNNALSKNCEQKMGHKDKWWNNATNKT